MGYTTEFDGFFKFNKPLTTEHMNAISDLYSDLYDTYDSNECPNSYFQWEISKEGIRLEWDGKEKFYNYIELLEYIVHKMVIPWGYTLNGKVVWSGEEVTGCGVIEIKDNVISVTSMRDIFH